MEQEKLKNMEREMNFMRREFAALRRRVANAERPKRECQRNGCKRLEQAGSRFTECELCKTLLCEQCQCKWREKVDDVPQNLCGLCYTRTKRSYRIQNDAFYDDDSD